MLNGAFDLILKQNKVRDAEPEVTLTVRLEDDPDAESPNLALIFMQKLKMFYHKKMLKNIYKMRTTFVRIQKLHVAISM